MRRSPRRARVVTRDNGKKLKLKVILLFAVLLVGLGLCELGLRIFWPGSFAAVEDEKSLTYRYDPELGWFPIPGTKKLFTASRTIVAAHNSRGFRGPEPIPSNKPAMIFLGDSLVWGFDVEASERFTEALQARHPEWVIHNFGVSGYGNDQEYLLLQRHFNEYAPRLVFLMICGDNDNDDNASNYRGGYYKPYYVIEGGGLRVQGVPVPRSERVFFAEHKILAAPYVVRLLVRVYCRFTLPVPNKRDNPPTGAIFLDMRRYVTERGAIFAVGLQHSNADLREFLEHHKIPYVDLETTNSALTYPTFSHHWTPAGHAFVAEKLDEFLKTL
jgi:hypothetical protein